MNRLLEPSSLVWRTLLRLSESFPMNHFSFLNCISQRNPYLDRHIEPQSHDAHHTNDGLSWSIISLLQAVHGYSEFSVQTPEPLLIKFTKTIYQSVTHRAGVDWARSSGRSGSEFGQMWLQRAGRCADSSFVSRI